MMINEVSKITGLTKKAIEYYIEQGLVAPTVLENGYRDFNSDAIERFKKISILRKLGINTNAIKKVLDDETGEALRKISVLNEINLQRQQAKQAVLDKLSSGARYCDIADELQSIENSTTIAEKLLNAFPGYLGRFFCLHFSRFLNEPIQTENQKQAYDKMLSLLDNLPDFPLTDEEKEYLLESTKHIGTEEIASFINSAKTSIEHPEKFLQDNKEILKQYLALKKSEEYKKLPAVQLQERLKQFNQTSGFYDVFIPAMKELSPSYAEYYKQLEKANEQFLTEFPEAEN